MTEHFHKTIIWLDGELIRECGVVAPSIEELCDYLMEQMDYIAYYRNGIIMCLDD